MVCVNAWLMRPRMFYYGLSHLFFKSNEKHYEKHPFLDDYECQLKHIYIYMSFK